MLQFICMMLSRFVKKVNVVVNRTICSKVTDNTCFIKKSARNSNETHSDLGKCFLGCKSVTTHQLVWKDHLLHALYINIFSLCAPPHRSLLKEDQWLFWKKCLFRSDPSWKENKKGPSKCFLKGKNKNDKYAAFGMGGAPVIPSNVSSSSPKTASTFAIITSCQRIILSWHSLAA